MQNRRNWPTAEIVSRQLLLSVESSILDRRGQLLAEPGPASRGESGFNRARSHLQTPIPVPLGQPMICESPPHHPSLVGIGIFGFGESLPSSSVVTTSGNISGTTYPP